MLGEKHLNLFFVAKNIARTASCQVDDSATTATYYKPGEVVIVSPGATWTVASDTSLTKAIEYISVKGQTLNSTHIGAPLFKGKYITSAAYKAYAAAVEQVVTLSGLAAPVVGDTYLLKFTVDHPEWGAPQRSKTIAFTAKTTVVADLYTGLTAAVNAQFTGVNNTDGTQFPIKATAAATYMKVESQYVAPEVGKFTYEKFTFDMILVDGSDIAHSVHSNKSATLATTTTDGLVSGVSANSPIAAAIATKGCGLGVEVREMEYILRSNHLPYAQRMSTFMPVNFELDAQVGSCYDYLTFTYQDRDTVDMNGSYNLFCTVTIACETGTNQGSNLKLALKDYLTDIGTAKLSGL